jgi:LPS export ABC transporter protein LptC
MSWHKPVRLAVGVFGIVAAVAVYFAIGARQTAVPPSPVERLDPKAVAEGTQAVLQQVRRGEEDFEVRADRTLTYDDGSVKLLGVRVSVRKRNGRDFVVTAREAAAGKDNKDLSLAGSVVLEASDGFRLTTDAATYAETMGMVQAPGRVSFVKGGLSGTGAGMTYDKNNDVLTLLAEADVTMAGTGETPGTSFKAGSAVLDRVMDVLVLSGGGHAERGEQVFEAATITARLADEEQYVRMIELRGDARVAGGGGTLDAMSAQAIDIVYVEGGDLIDRVTLIGNAAAALVSKDSSTEGSNEKEPGRRQLVGGALEMQLGADGSLVHAAGRDGIRFDLPVTERARASSIQARSFDAKGEPGAGLTSASFVDDVQFREEGVRDAAPRTARSRTLDLNLRQDEVEAATFKGSVAFEERGLVACAAEVRYDPRAGAITLNGSDAGGGPRASDTQVAIAARTIGVTLQGTQMAARGDVKTVLRPPREARGNCLPRTERPAAGAAATTDKDSRLPGLLKDNVPVNVNADSLTYAGAGGAATYTGNATLWQGETAIRADELRLDQEKGDLVAAGSARSTLILGGRHSVGSADEIRYEDARRLVTYETKRPARAGRPGGAARGAAPAAAAETAGRARGPGAPGVTTGVNPTRGGTQEARGRGPAVPIGPKPAYLQGPQGEMRAWRIEMVLTPDAGRADRLEAYDDVNLRVETRRATGDRLTYFAEDERYVMTGSAVSPVCVVDPTRATTGKTLVFYRSADRILVDGNEETRTQTRSGGVCAPSPVR